MAKFLIQPHVRLHEWVAEEKGFFRDEGLATSSRRRGSPAPRSRLPR